MNTLSALKPSTAKTAKSEKSSEGPLAFADYVGTLSVYSNPRGDFIADTKTLINAGVFPIVTCWSELYCFMRGRHACPEAIELARKVWRQYSKSQTAVSPASTRRANPCQI